ncbi:MAG: lytic transglycosylase domain-containing protein [Chloroflexi bacterium]|nr:MAG: lytic transglycosylase domain-containing protein [Chloroflexota bacterium]
MDDAATINAPSYFNHLRFATYYSDLVIPEAQETGIHPLLLFSIIRQESFFESFAFSPAGASGLMQFMSATGQERANLLGWPPDYRQTDLLRPVVSITFGADYLSNLLEYLDGDIFAALAGYNGGPGNSKIWKDLSNGDQDLFLEIVRFEETRRYITTIYEVFTIYRRLYSRTP